MRRLSAALALVPLVLVSACSGDPDDGEGAPPADLANDLAAGLELTAAAIGTDKKEEAASGAAMPDVAFVGQDPAAVAEDFVAVVAGMNGIAPTVEGEISGDAITLTWSWPVVEGKEPWTYETTAEVGEDGDSWAVVWDRTVVEPSLKKNDTLEATTVPARRGEIRGAGGKVLVTERPVVRYGIDRVRVSGPKAAAAARELATLVGIDVAPYVAAVKAAGDRAFVEAITYREGEVPPTVRRTALDIEGALAVADEIALAPTREFAAPIIGRVGPVTAEMIEEDPDAYEVGDIVGVSGLQQRYDEQLRGADGRVVEAANPNRARNRELYRVPATDGETLALTMDERLQTAAESLLAGVGPASAIVALRPSDGAILAAANGPGTEGLNHATYGQLAPGSTFKIVSSLALLRSGLEPGSTLPCTATTTVDGKQFKNYDDYPSSAVGDVPLSTAVAQSCNTAFISQRDRLGKGDLAAAAAALGLGIDHDLGFPAYFGQVPKAASETEAAADLIGQGKILASPMVMATVIASVQEGAVVVPRLVEQVEVEAPDVERLTRTEADQLRGMLRQVVTEGSGRALADVPGAPVIAKTGTAEFERSGRIETHAWMVAAQGDLAVAVFVELGESGSQTAGPILEEFLRAAG